MDIASPFSMLDRMRPDQAARHAGQVFATGVHAAAKQNADKLAEAAQARLAGAADRTGQGFAAVAAGVDRGGARHLAASDDTGQRIGSDGPRQRGGGDPVHNPLEAHATGRDLFDRLAERAAQPVGPRPAAADGASPHGRSASTAEMVVAAGLDGLDAFAHGPGARMAIGLAQATYNVSALL